MDDEVGQEPSQPDERWFMLFVLFLILIAAIVIESLSHPTRDAEIVVTDAGVHVEPLPDAA
jgi:hypothetical protein